MLTIAAALAVGSSRPQSAVQLFGAPVGVRHGAFGSMARLKFWKPSGAVSKVWMSAFCSLITAAIVMSRFFTEPPRCDRLVRRKPATSASPSCRFDTAAEMVARSSASWPVAPARSS